MRAEEEIIDLGGPQLLLRNAEEEDAEMLLDFLKTTCGETRYLVKEPEEIDLTLEDERTFIRNPNESDQNIMLLGFVDGEYAGNCSLMGMGAARFKHRASLGIALYQKYTGRGIGKAMIGKLIEIAREHNLEQIELEVVADNQRAVSLYRKMGFEIFGTLPNNMKYQDGTYADAYWMMKSIRR